MPISKSEIVSWVREQLRGQMERMRGAAEASRNAATDEESRAEGKYDTRGLEASYLAAGQAKQAEELAEAVASFTPAAFPDFAPGAGAAVGALVEAEQGGGVYYYLLAHHAGGLTCAFDGHEVTVLTPGAPLAQQLVGKAAGAEIEHPPLTVRAVL